MRQHAAEEAERPPVRVVRDDDVLARLHQPERRVNRRHPRREGVAEARALQGRDVALDGQARRVLRARVLVALVPTESVLRVSGRLINRNRHRARRRVGVVARVYGCCSKAHKLNDECGMMNDE